MKQQILLDSETKATLYTETDVPAPWAAPLLVIESRGQEGLGGYHWDSTHIAGKQALERLVQLLQPHV